MYNNAFNVFVFGISNGNYGFFCSSRNLMKQRVFATIKKMMAFVHPKNTTLFCSFERRDEYSFLLHFYFIFYLTLSCANIAATFCARYRRPLM